MQPRALALISWVGMAVLASGCGASGASAKGTAPDSYSIGVEVSSPSALPKCTASLSGTVAYASSPPSLWECSGLRWHSIACTNQNAGAVAYAAETQLLLACSGGNWAQIPIPAGPPGPQGPDGGTGPQGPPGEISLVLVTQEPPGSNCALGGVRVDTGLDANGDGVLETTEIQHTAYACTVQVGGGPGGVPGADGGVAGNGGGGGGAPVVCNAGGAPGPAINLGSLGPPRTVAAGINDLGQIVGESGARAFLWEAGVMRDLGLGGFSSAAAMAINNRGQVAGLVEDSAGASHAALWENGNLRLLGTPSGWDDSVYAINESGQVLGVSAELVSRRTHGVVWDAAGRHDLTAPSGGLIQPGGLHAMNDRGDVVGWMESAPGQGQRAFLFSAGVITDLGTLGGSTASANAINNAGQIVGMSATASGESHTYLWQAGSMQDLTVQSGGLCGGPLTITEAGDVLCGVTTGTFKAYVWSAGAVQNVTGANALAVVPVLMNDCGQVAGQITLSSQVVHPFIWQGGQMLDLGLPAGEAYVNPMALNNRGDLVLSGGSAAYLVSWR